MTKWYGMQTIDNTPQIADMLRELLEGKRYTFASSNAGFLPDSRLALEVRTGEKMEGVRVWKDTEVDPPRFAGFNVSDTYGVWGVSTSNTSNKFDPTYDSPYWVFEWHEARVVHRAPSGNLLIWVVSVEKN